MAKLTLNWYAFSIISDALRPCPFDILCIFSGYFFGTTKRLTTKTNTFTVHYKVQVLRKARQSSLVLWDEELDSVVAEESNATLIERYLDVTDPAIPDYATEPNAPSLGRFYRYRIVETRNSP